MQLCLVIESCGLRASTPSTAGLRIHMIRVEHVVAVLLAKAHCLAAQEQCLELVALNQKLR